MIFFQTSSQISSINILINFLDNQYIERDINKYKEDEEWTCQGEQ